MATQTIMLGEILDRLTVEGELYEKLENNAVRCYACGHRCLIKDGREGICRVRFNQGGTMNDKNYRRLGAELPKVLKGIEMVHERGFWLEIVTLTIPGFNDSNEELWDAARFIASIPPDIPWHVTAFHKDYKMTDPANTDVKTLLRAAEIVRVGHLVIFVERS